MRSRTEVNSRHALKWAVIGWLMEKPGTRIIWSTHRAVHARDAFEDMIGLVQDMGLPIEKASRVNGGEYILLRDRGEIIFRSRVSCAHRGYSADKLILDDSDYLTDSQLGSLLPCVVTRKGEVIYSQRVTETADIV